MDKPYFEFYHQYYFEVFLIFLFFSIILTNIIYIILSRKIKKKGKIYSEAALIEIYSNLQHKYRLEVSLNFVKNSWSNYNMMNKIITIRKKKRYSEEDYIALLHEVAHAIDFTWYKGDTIIKLKGIGAIGAIGAYLLGLWSLSLLQLEIGLVIGTIFLLIVMCCGMLDFLITLKIERDADAILIEDLLGESYKAIVKLAEVIQMLDRLFVFCFLVFLFFLLRENIYLAP